MSTWLSESCWRASLILRSSLWWEIWERYERKNFGVWETVQRVSENRVFSLKTHLMFSVHTTPEKFKYATITGYFGFVFQKNLSRELTELSCPHRFRKAPFSKFFNPPSNSTGVIWKFFRKASFSWISPASCGPELNNNGLNRFGIVFC